MSNHSELELDKSGLSHAFNRGCQARLHGIDQDCNPYPRGCPYCLQWDFGWEDVDEHWGALVAGRWQYAPLPEVARPCR